MKLISNQRRDNCLPVIIIPKFFFFFSIRILFDFGGGDVENFIRVLVVELCSSFIS